MACVFLSPPWPGAGSRSTEQIRRAWSQKLKEGDERVLAQADDPTEHVSLQNLAQALREQATPSDSRPALPPESPQFSACGARLAPSEAETTPCGHCGQSVPTNPEVRHRVVAGRAHVAAMTEHGARLTRLLDQPSARFANARIWLSSAIIGALVLTFIASQIVLLGVGIIEQFSPGISAVASILLAFLGGFMLRRRFVDRQALQSVVSLFGTRAPLRQGEPFGCSGCGGPLPPESSVLVRCIFCGRDKVFGAPLARTTTSLERDLRLLEPRAAPMIALFPLHDSPGIVEWL
jgi:hypothetical protein